MSETSPISPFGPMRRRKREITDRAEIDAILRESKVMRLALADDNRPFVVPVFFAYNGRAIYFHSAREGTKIEILKRNKNVCFEISVEGGVLESDIACDFEAKHRTVIGFGEAAFVEDAAEKKNALDKIVAKFSDKKFDYPEKNLAMTLVVRIDIESLTGKKYGF
jgi:uncharacterized protein